MIFGTQLLVDLQPNILLGCMGNLLSFVLEE